MIILRLLGRIVKWTCLTLGALTLAVILLGVTAALLWDGRDAGLPDQMVLKLDLAEGFDHGRYNPFSAFDPDRPARFTQILSALDRAGRDDRVKGLYVYAGHGDLAMAEMQELSMAVRRFRHGGKPAYLFAETFGETGDGTTHYLLATSFDKIFIQPSGEVRLTGFLLQAPFARDLLDEWGVTTQIGAREAYKGAPSFLTDTQMPEPVRRNLQILIDDWRNQAIDAIADGRKMTRAQATGLFDDGPYRAAAAKDAGLIDDLMYERQAAALLRSDLGLKPGEDFISAHAYAQDGSPRKKTGEGNAARIAVIEGSGPIMYGEPSPLDDGGPFLPSVIDQAFDRALDDSKVKAIIFRVDSPGGSYAASDTIAHSIQRARQAGIPVIVSMGNQAASGGYLISVAADRIVAAPGTVTGSIGVFAGKVVFDEFWRRLGVNWDVVASGPNATTDSALREYSPEQWTRLQQDLDIIYDDFLTRVAAARNLSRDQVRGVAGGQIWSGATAKAQGLVDDDQGWFGALRQTRAMLSLTEDTPLELRFIPLGDDDWFGFAEHLVTEVQAVARLRAQWTAVLGQGAGIRAESPVFGH